MINKSLLKHALFWFGFMLAFLGSFEQALDAGNDPIFSGVYGFPIPHHYVTGFIIIFIAYFLFNRKDWVLTESYNKMIRDFKRLIKEI